MSKILTSQDLKKRAGHSCHLHLRSLNTCGCFCGRSYDKDWECIISERGGMENWVPVCKCVPDPPQNTEKAALCETKRTGKAVRRR